MTAIFPRHFCRFISRRDQPAAILALAKQRGKTGSGIKSRKAQPINRPIATDQRPCLRIAKKSVIFDLHSFSVIPSEVEGFRCASFKVMRWDVSTVLDMTPYSHFRSDYDSAKRPIPSLVNRNTRQSSKEPAPSLL